MGQLASSGGPEEVCQGAEGGSFESFRGSGSTVGHGMGSRAHEHLHAAAAQDESNSSAGDNSTSNRHGTADGTTPNGEHASNREADASTSTFQQPGATGSYTHGQNNASNDGGSAGEGHPQRSHDADDDDEEGYTNANAERGECMPIGSDPSSDPAGRPGSQMRMRQTGREAEGQEGRTPKGSHVLEVHSTRMPILPVGAIGGELGKKPQEERTKHTRQLEEGRKDPSGDDKLRRGALRRGDGQWCECTTARMRRWARQAQRRGKGGARGSHFWADFRYQRWEGSKKEWLNEEGAVPLHHDDPIRVWVQMTDRAAAEDAIGSEQSTAFTKQQRRKVTEAMSRQEADWVKVEDKHMAAACYLGRKVCEVYSPPRVASRAKQHSMEQGVSIDLLTGWDLEDPSAIQAMWQKLEEEDPILVVICPPCTAFSQLQEWNYRRMKLARSMSILRLGLHHLKVAIKVAEWQHKRGGYVVYEHPHGARSWQEDEVKRLMKTGFQRTRCDMCEYGMNVTGEGLNLKPTGILTNSPKIAEQLSRRCRGTHEHVQLLHGLGKKAQVYPEGFCKAILRGLATQLKEDEGFWAMAESYAAHVQDGEEETEEEEDEAQVLKEIEDAAKSSEPPKKELVERGEGLARYQVTHAEQEAVKKLHKNIGHPATSDMIRFMRAARVRGEVIRWAAKEFRCDICQAKVKPKSVRPGTIPRSFQPNKVIGVDLLFLPDVGGGTFPAVSIVDWGTSYHMVERVDSKNPEEVWTTVNDVWFRVFGPPEVIVTDPGREFSAKFGESAMALGIVTYQTAARAPWQQGKTERHGAHFKDLLAKARSEAVVTDKAELKMLMVEVEQAKNRYSNRSGFSPVQRQIGQWPRVPGEILTDQGVDPQLLSGAMTDDLERLHEMRRIAQKAFAETNTQDVMKRAIRGRSRVVQEFQPGDYVFVYRVPRGRKKKDGTAQSYEVATGKPTWVGPGTVLLADGPNVWVTMLGELWKVAREQCRQATTDEKHGIEAVLGECKELIEEYKRNPHRAGYKDISSQPWPPLEDEERVETPRSPSVKRGYDEVQSDVEVVSEGYSPSVADQVVGPPSSHGDEPEVEMVPSNATAVEQEQHHMPAPSITPAPTGEIPIPAGTTQQDTNPHMDGVDPRFTEMVRQSQQRSNRLDGLPPPGEPLRRQLKVKGTNEGWNPYWCQNAIIPEEDEEEAEEESQKMFFQAHDKEGRRRNEDFWQWDQENGILQRRHVKKRRARFDITACKDFEVVQSMLEDCRTTKMMCQGQDGEREEEDTWKIPQYRRRSEGRWWKGSTEFYLKKGKTLTEEDQQKISAFIATKKGQDEVVIQRESPKDQDEWRKADRAEWDKIVNSSAVKVLSLEESKEVRAKLREAGKEARILPTKVARRYKPGDQPGEEPTKKSRLCIRGDLDPDALNLERFSPTLNTMSFNVMLQVASNNNYDAEVADFKSAFCQSKPLEREEGPLYFQPPKEGIQGVSEEQVVQILSGVYGLVDGPIHWRQTLVPELQELGYTMSKMDPCIMLLHEKPSGRMLGAVAIEVDDLFMVGGDEHKEKMKTLRSKYEFGKWVSLKETENGCAFNGRRIRQKRDGEFLIDMQKFVEERLHPIPLEKGRASKRKEDATQEEKEAARATCGALNWLSKEGRPDAAGPSSLLASKLTKLKVEDVVHINDVVKTLKEHSGLAVRIQPLKGMRFAVVTDASFANDGFHSQGGHVIVAHEKELQLTGKGTANVILWKSGKLQRVVNSTLAAETQSLSRGMGDLLWTMVVAEEFCDGNFSLRTWPERLSAAQVVAMASSDSSGTLKEALAVVDAKSLFDYLSKETVGGQDRRTAIEVQIIREDLQALGGKIRWVDHPSMVADGLTKIRGSNEALYKLLETGQFHIQAEMEQMSLREEARRDGMSASQIRRTGIKEKGRDVNSRVFAD